MNALLRLSFLILALSMSAQLRAEVDVKKAEVLTASYKAAFDSKDLAALMKLVHWERVEDNIKLMMRTGFERVLQLDLVSLETAELGQDDSFQFENKGVKYGPNLFPVARLLIEFKPDGVSQYQVASSSYLIGEIDGRYMITTSAPVK